MKFNVWSSPVTWAAKHRRTTTWLLICLTIGSCRHLSQLLSPWWSSRPDPFSIQVVDLMDPSLPLANPAISWSGDWTFRRDRLEVIDRGLNQVASNLVALINAAERNVLAQESDLDILQAGVLAGFEFQSVVVRQDANTAEQVRLGIAAAPPLTPDPLFEDHHILESDARGQLFCSLIHMSSQPIPLCLLNLPTPDHPDAYFEVYRKIHRFLLTTNSCAQHLILAGVFAGGREREDFALLCDLLQLTEVTPSTACRPGSPCWSQTLPDLQEILSPERNPYRKASTRVLAHRSATILEADQMHPDALPTTGDPPGSALRYGLTRPVGSPLPIVRATIWLQPCTSEPQPSRPEADISRNESFFSSAAHTAPCLGNDSQLVAQRRATVGPWQPHRRSLHREVTRFLPPE